jgi:hypothetical protein
MTARKCRVDITTLYSNNASLSLHLTTMLAKCQSLSGACNLSHSSYLARHQPRRHQLSLLPQKTLRTLLTSTQHDGIALQPATEVEPCGCHELVLTLQGCKFSRRYVARRCRCNARANLLPECCDFRCAVLGELKEGLSVCFSSEILAI